MITLSGIVLRIRAWDVLGELYQQNAALKQGCRQDQGRPYCQREGLEGFSAASQVDIKATKNLDALIGENGLRSRF